MKMMLISLLIMLSIVVGSALNCHKARATTDELISALGDITNEHDGEGLESFCSMWESHRTYFLFTIPMPRIDNVDNAVLALRASVSSGSRAEYEKGKLMAERYISDIAEYSSLSLKNIL